MSTEPMTTPEKFKVTEVAARNWFIAFMYFTIVYVALIVWGIGLKYYVDEQLQREIGTTLVFLLMLTMIHLAKEMFPVIYLIVRQMHYEIAVWPKEHDAWFEETMRRESEERKQKFLEELKAKEAKRRKKQKPVGEPIDLKQWIGTRSYWRGGYIYILKDTEISGYYKIGKTRKPHERMKAFGVHLPFAAELIHVIECYSADEVERRLHGQFADKRKRGEWFALTDEDVAALKLIHKVEGHGTQIQ